jgi:hypothetical protein
MAVGAATQAGRYVFQGREVTLPVVVRDASSSAATYLVDAAAARTLLRGPELDVVEVFPGWALFSLACIDYVDNDLGDYGEVCLALFVRRAGDAPLVPYAGNVVDFFRNRLATYIVHLPVDQTFTRDAGEGIWGFPKTVQRIDIADTQAHRTCRLEMDGRHVLTATSFRGGRFSLPDMAMKTYSYVGGVLHETTFVSGATEVGFGLGGTDVVLGDHPIADDLRRLGLPRSALMTVWMGHQHGRFEAPVRV